MERHIAQLIEAAAQDNIEAINQLSYIYSQEQTDYFDLEQAQYYLKRGLALGSSYCAYTLGTGYMNGIYGMDVKVASTYFEQAIELGDYKGYYALARIAYEETEDITLFLSYLSKGVKAGDSACMMKLASLYLEGHYVDQDVNKAIKLYEHMASMYVIEACYALATLYLDKRFNEAIDVPKARRYAIQAAELGSSEAFILLAYLNASGLDELGEDYFEAFINLKKAQVIARIDGLTEQLNVIDEELLVVGASLEAEDIEDAINEVRAYFDEMSKLSGQNFEVY